MLPQADDDTLIAYAHLVVDEYTALNARSPEDCYLYGKGQMPRTINLVTGPSRSADIEQTLILGAHGPRRLHIVVVAD